MTNTHPLKCDCDIDDHDCMVHLYDGHTCSVCGKVIPSERHRDRKSDLIDALRKLDALDRRFVIDHADDFYRCPDCGDFLSQGAYCPACEKGFLARIHPHIQLETPHPLIENVIEQMKRDIEMGDWTAIEQLLSFCPERDLREFLSEKDTDDGCHNWDNNPDVVW